MARELRSVPNISPGIHPACSGCAGGDGLGQGQMRLSVSGLQHHKAVQGSVF